MIKKNLLFLCVLVLQCKAQSPAACVNGVWLCGTSNFSLAPTAAYGFSATLNVSNPTVNPQGVNNGCSQSGAPAPYWFFFTAITSGSLGFSIGDPASGNPQQGYYDWNLWPYSSTACNDIYNNALQPVSCNWNDAPSGGTGVGSLPTGANAGNFQPSIPVNAGDSFVLLVSNYSGVNAMVTFSGTGTAIIGCAATGVKSNTSEKRTGLFPNPATDKVTVTAPTPEKRIVTMSTIEGLPVNEIEVDTERAEISLGHINAGVYIMRITDPRKNSEYHKLIKN